ncbi:MAG: hypothetical protein DSY82_03510 [Flavobacteriia bacterium]|nr:MAG: hypothetical protein DSY82_03510 [Flavobacteriia bacterium]
MKEIYLKTKNQKLFDFIDNKKLRNSIELFFAYAYDIYENIDDYKNDEFLTEFKTHTIIIYLGSVVEALIFYYANKKL